MVPHALCLSPVAHASRSSPETPENEAVSTCIWLQRLSLYSETKMSVTYVIFFFSVKLKREITFEVATFGGSLLPRVITLPPVVLHLMSYTFTPLSHNFSWQLATHLTWAQTDDRQTQIRSAMIQLHYISSYSVRYISKKLFSSST